MVGGQNLKDSSHSDSHSTNAGLTRTLARFDSDTIKREILRHRLQCTPDQRLASPKISANGTASEGFSVRSKPSRISVLPSFVHAQARRSRGSRTNTNGTPNLR